MNRWMGFAGLYCCHNIHSRTCCESVCFHFSCLLSLYVVISFHSHVALLVILIYWAHDYVTILPLQGLVMSILIIMVDLQRLVSIDIHTHSLVIIIHFSLSFVMSTASSASSSASSSSSCAICFGELADESPVVLQPCGHSLFHLFCIREWLNINSKCPLCRCEDVSIEFEVERLGPWWMHDDRIMFVVYWKGYSTPTIEYMSSLLPHAAVLVDEAMFSC